MLEHGWPLLFYTIISLFLLWPLPLNLTSVYPATPGEGAQDLWQNLWNLWWAGESLLRGMNPFFTDMLFYPRGASLLFHPLNLTAGLLALPFGWLAGPVFAYNTLVLLSFILSGYAVFLLARQYACGRAAALLGGLVYTASAFHFAHLRLGHLEQVSMQWLPLYALALDAVLRRPTIARVAATTLALLLVIFTSLYMALYAALLTGLWALWFIGAAVRRHAPRNALAPMMHLAVALALTLAIVGPMLLIPMAREAQQATYMRRSIDDAARGSAAPLDALLPPSMHPLRAVLRMPSPISLGAFLGYLPLALAIYSAGGRRQSSARWIALALLAWSLSLGPQTPLYRLLYRFPPLQVARYPDRFAILAVLGVAVAAAIGADALWSRLQGRARWAAVALVLGLLLVEVYPRGVPLTKPIDNPFYHQLAREPGRFSVFELPINRFNNVWVDMVAQTIHGKPILYGALARDVPHIPFESLPLMRELEHPDRPHDIVLQSIDARVAALRFFNLRYLIYHRADENGPVTPPMASALSRVAGVPISQVYSDDQLVAYRVDTAGGPAALPPFINLGEGWYDLESPGAAAHRWIRGDAGLLQVYAPADTTVRLRLKFESYHQARPFDIYLDGQPVARIEAQPWLSEVRTTPFALSGGPHTLRLAPNEPGTPPRSVGDGDDIRPLTVAVFELEIETGG